MINIKKVLVSIYVLTLDKTYDVKIPINLSVKETIYLIQTAITEMSKGAYNSNYQAKLYEGINGNLINSNNIVKYSGIKNGETLLLV